MKHKMDIWAKNKFTGSNHIAGHSEITDEDIEEMALKMFLENSTMLLEDTFEYSARLDETII